MHGAAALFADCNVSQKKHEKMIDRIRKKVEYRVWRDYVYGKQVVKRFTVLSTKICRRKKNGNFKERER